VSRHFIDLTKAYKALTDEAIRENLRLYGNPDGKIDFKVGIALPPWVIESSNNGWVLGAYALLFGGALPYLVGRWWFGSRRLTKDGVLGRTAETYFKNLTEDDSVFDGLRVLAQGWQFETFKPSTTSSLDANLQTSVEEGLGIDIWRTLAQVGLAHLVHTYSLNFFFLSRTLVTRLVERYFYSVHIFFAYPSRVQPLPKVIRPESPAFSQLY
jgi:translocation protein SEC63